MEPLLSLNNVEVIYNDVILVLKGMSLKVEPGKIVALLGGNGGGKSTTLKAISGLLKSEEGEVTDGSITFCGERIDNTDPEAIVRRGIFQVMEGRRVFDELTVHDNLVAGAHTRRHWRDAKRDLDMVFCYFPRLKERRHNIAGYLSGGEQQMLAIGRALMARPKLMLLDEPSLGLAPLLVREIFEIIKRINEEEKAHDPARRAERPRGARRSRTTATSWRTARSCSTTPSRSSRRTRTSRSSTSGSRRSAARRASGTSSTTGAGSGGCPEGRGCGVCRRARLRGPVAADRRRRSPLRLPPPETSASRHPSAQLVPGMTESR